jgi:Type II CAAX prenyl endopeptidase Rce1-like
MINQKWLAPILPYFAVWAGLFLFKSAWLAIIGFHASILLGLSGVLPKIPVNILFKGKSFQWVLINVLLCSASGIGLYFLWGRLDIAPDLSAQLVSLGLTSSSWFAFITYFTLVNPCMEEYFWRGVLGSNSKKLYIGDLVYAGYHAIILWGRVNPFSILLVLVVLTSAGWFWRQLAREEDGLFAAVLGHMLADFSILMAVYWKCV